MGIGKYFSLVKFAHTLFALPFALIGYAWGVAVAGFDPWILLKVLLCMVFARNAAMGFNRVIDRRFDAENERTAMREIPNGQISVQAGKWFVFLNSVGFIAVAATFNWLTLILSPIALGVILGYSYTKRFTALCHFILALGLAIAPCGAYIAVTGTLDNWLPVLIASTVLTWVSGFDILYALQDASFDRSQGLHSVPARLGIKKSIGLSIGLHTITALTVILTGILFFPTRWLYAVAALIFIGMLIYQHTKVKPLDYSKVDLTFTTINGVTSVAYATFVILAIFF